jgi:hypothetical protein
MYRACDVYRGNVSKSHFYQWVREGRVRLYKVGRAVYVDETFPEIIRRLAAEDQAASALPDEAA